MGRPKQNPEDSTKRARILEVAGKMFLDQGFGGVSMDAIAEAAPVSKPTLYSHFKDKEALFLAVVEPRCQAMYEHLEASSKTEGGVEEAMFHIGMDFLELALSPEAISVHRTIMGEAQKFPALGQIFYEAGPKRSLALLSAYFQAQHDAGVLNVPDPHLSASVFISMLKGYPHMQLLLGLKKTVTRKEREAHVRYVVNIFINGHRLK